MHETQALTKVTLAPILEPTNKEAHVATVMETAMAQAVNLIYAGSPYPAELSEENGELVISAVVLGKPRKNTVKNSLAEGYHVHIQLGRDPSATQKVTLKRALELLQDINANTKFSVEATCVGGGNS